MERFVATDARSYQSPEGRQRSAWLFSPGDEPIRFDTGDKETGLIVLGGHASVVVDGQPFSMGKYDTLYVPRDASVTVSAGEANGCDLAEVAAPVSAKHPLRFIPFADVQRDPGLHFTAGAAASKRELNVLIGKNVRAGRIMAGVTFSEPGNWTSWPPHEHAILAEEAYLYIEMPPPSFGIQLV